ncbi:MAG: class I mannose-6-phosphate isomerase [Culicoidibacterales bacterium]
MDFKNRKATYNKFPVINVEGFDEQYDSGYEQITKKILANPNNKIIVVDCYIGVNDEEVLQELIAKIKPDTVIHTDDIFYNGATLNRLLAGHITEDRVRGVMYYGKLTDFVNQKSLEITKKSLRNLAGITLIYGVGASIITKGDVLIYADLARWEIQLRYRNGLANFRQTNADEDFLRKYKRGFFIEWRVADKHKKSLYDEVDFWLDTNTANKPKMITKAAFMAAMSQVVEQPFRVVPYFDPGVWGGQWMKSVCDLDRTKPNYAWSFDGVPEENSLLLGFGDQIFEMPSINVVLYKPQLLLGKKVYARFGAEFPIRFDFLDTMGGGQNLSLQVHPTADFIRQEYGMPYTQEESYYLLDAEPGAVIYLGVKNDVDAAKMERDLEKAARGEISFPAEKYVNMITTKPHDHFLIPPGTIHCSGSGTMVLEISASAYIFTFKLWDWDRVGLDGISRPIHLEEGKAVLNYDYDTTFVENELVNQFEVLEETTNFKAEKTGLHELEYIGTHRYRFTQRATFETNGTVQMLNLIEGEEITVESPTNDFKPFIIHYAETFIIPANVNIYTMKPTGMSHNKMVMVLQAFVK